MKGRIFVFSLILFLLAFTLPAISANSSSLPIQSWLKLGPVPEVLPAFAAENSPPIKVKDLLDFQFVDKKDWWPESGQQFVWDAAHTLRWETLSADSSGTITLEAPGESNEVVYLAAYLQSDRWLKARVTVETPFLVQIFLDGKSVGSKKSASRNQNGTSKNGRAVGKLKLETGKHLLLLKALRPAGAESPWTIQATVTVDSPFTASDLKTDLSPTRIMSVSLLLDTPEVTRLSVSPDGELVAISLTKSQPPSDSKERWIEIRRVKDGSLVETYRGGTAISAVRWAPIGHRFAYTTGKKNKISLWIVDLDAGTNRLLLKDVANLQHYTWSPDGTFLVYSVQKTAPKNKTGLKRWKSLSDRQPRWRNRSFLYQVNLPEGTTRRLTAGKLTTSLQAISPDGRYLLFSEEVDEPTVRPYVRHFLFRLDLQTLAVDSLWNGHWFNSARWAPDGKHILLVGGPSMFGKLGWNVPEGKIPNEYDHQLYLFDPETRKAECLTRKFNPSVRSIFTNRNPREVYLTTEDGAYRHLYRLDLSTRRFKLIPLGVEVVRNMTLAYRKPLAVYEGASSNVPPRIFAVKLKKNRRHLVVEPGGKDFRHLKLGKVESWSFVNGRGDTIRGRIYYPPDFDPEKTYPCIVYYYGGTTTVSRDFGGRYPKNLWAANGYVVYVLQPSGAIGYGQAFSSYHVNDWGKIVADEIIDGVKKFLAAHPFVDRKRVGNIGASYGGFMTMLLATKTDLFAASVAHAGISLIPSYWGEGYWGYIYNARSAANSFPWNRPDIYINQSPLMHADKIKTPLLLLHGSVDTNVPPGESTQLYTALKILGKPVEYIQINDQNHWVVTYNRRKLWTKTILAWFDRWLKDQPQWWNDLYPDKEN